MRTYYVEVKVENEDNSPEYYAYIVTEQNKKNARKIAQQWAMDEYKENLWEGTGTVKTSIEQCYQTTEDARV